MYNNKGETLVYMYLKKNCSTSILYFVYTIIYWFSGYKLPCGNIMINISAIPSCAAKIEGLVHYPTTPAPVNGMVTVTSQCADNAHSDSSTMRVSCDSNGIWSNHTTPECHCNDGYRILDITGETPLCEGERKLISF